MRALLLSLVLLLPALAGCLAAQVDDLTAGSLDPATLTVPAGAELVTEPGRAILRFADVALPFRETIVVPEGTTIVRAVGVLPIDAPIFATMWHEDTGRRRCNTDRVDAWNVPVTGTSVCSGMAAIDPPGARWVVSIGATLPVDIIDQTMAGAGLEEPEPVLALVDIVFETAPVDGLAASLDLSQLSMPTHELRETEYLMVESFDGTPMWVEVTLPEGEGPWPTVFASSPYNGQTGRGEKPAMWEYFTHDWAKRGYAIVNADVRGFGMSGGCVEVWGINEQKDQAFLVDWIASQPWSDGNVGFYGQSYVGTTPVEAAVQGPDALKAIIAVAPVINAYYDWHFGGVPNGENSGSPVAYQVLTDMPGQGDLTDPLSILDNAAKGVCDPTLIVRANDPRAIYDSFYEERNFSKRASDITAAVLYTQGFEDSNVKSAMIPWWFNELTAPKLGLFGHFVHQHPTRADEEILFLGWMDQYVKGKPLGFENLPNVEVVIDNQRSRTDEAWPPLAQDTLELSTDFAGGKLGEGASGDANLMLLPAGTGAADQRPAFTLELPIEQELAIAGIPSLRIEGMHMNGGNAYFYGALYEVDGQDAALVTYGMFNLAHRNGHETYAPAAPAETVTFELPFLPTEWIFREGSTLRLVVAGTADRGETPSQPGVFMLHGGEASQLRLPLMDLDAYGATAATATP